jgi:hypothetical protein
LSTTHFNFDESKYSFNKIPIMVQEATYRDPDSTTAALKGIQNSPYPFSAVAPAALPPAFSPDVIVSELRKELNVKVRGEGAQVWNCEEEEWVYPP